MSASMRNRRSLPLFLSLDDTVCCRVNSPGGVASYCSRLRLTSACGLSLSRLVIIIRFRQHSSGGGAFRSPGAEALIAQDSCPFEVVRNPASGAIAQRGYNMSSGLDLAGSGLSSAIIPRLIRRRRQAQHPPQRSSTFRVSRPTKPPTLSDFITRAGLDGFHRAEAGILGVIAAAIAGGDGGGGAAHGCAPLTPIRQSGCRRASPIATLETWLTQAGRGNESAVSENRG
jgi:hypothetical protein